MRVQPFFLICIAAALAWTPRALGAESLSNCAGYVTKIPTVISTPGTWCLKQDLTTAVASVKAITISADHVTLDCNDFTLSETAGTANTATGVSAVNHLDGTVRHCNLVGFRYGAYLQATTGGGRYLVEDNRIDGSTYEGVHVEGDGSTVRRNLVTSTGGSTTVVGAYGIYAVDSVTISGNTVAGVTARTGSNGKAYGIVTSNSPNGSITGNRVRGLAKDGSGKDYAISNMSSGFVTVRDNEVFGDASAGTIGISCTNANGSAKHNMINGFGSATAVSGCTNAGDNDIAP